MKENDLPSKNTPGQRQLPTSTCPPLGQLETSTCRICFDVGPKFDPNCPPTEFDYLYGPSPSPEFDPLPSNYTQWEIAAINLQIAAISKKLVVLEKKLNSRSRKQNISLRENLTQIRQSQEKLLDLATV
jgi:hypothetical protein